ncbi:MAG: hypothetical protein LBN25_01260 [Christensenellaceae bacterium]|jgi:hypothetical protein|nr:hypothetical protein [Christensenellaceae bacterium]
MAEEIKITESDVYAANIFLGAAVPLLRVICESEPKYGDKFKGKFFVFQMSALYDGVPGGKIATHFVVEDGKWTCKALEVHESPDVEFQFANLRKLNIFMSGKGMPLPRIKGASKLGLLISLLGALLRMAGLMQATTMPVSDADKKLLTKLYFYLLPNGISRLSKMGQPDVLKVTSVSPDRVYALVVNGDDELQSWVRMKEGQTSSGRGASKRGIPFLSMEFRDPASALGILMNIDNMMDSIETGKLLINGAPEFGDLVGDLMFKVAYYAQGEFLVKEKLL